MTEEVVRAAYGVRAAEYIEKFGSIDQMHEADRRLIARWAAGLSTGPVLDAGCGPGHWTAYLDGLGHRVVGLDLTAEFIDHARARFPNLTFRIGSLGSTDLADQSVGGVLAWYSLIHTPPDGLPALLREFRRILRPGGGLLLGFFDGIAGESFPHAVTTAYFWSVDALSTALERAGFSVDGSKHRREGGIRALAAISATVGASR